jgi:transcription termination factor Rho
MAVMERSELEASPLADLHAIADQVGLDGFRRLRKAELIDTIIERTGGDAGESRPAAPA